mgnify:CR=1 FL=1
MPATGPAATPGRGLRPPVLALLLALGCPAVTLVGPAAQSVRVDSQQGGGFDVQGLAGHGEGESRFIESAAVTAKLQATLHLFDLIVGTEEEFHIAGGTTDTIAALRAVLLLTRRLRALGYYTRSWGLGRNTGNLKRLQPLLDGLSVVHAAGFLHRDIKPDNIQVRADDGSLVLLDFGSARQAAALRLAAEGAHGEERGDGGIDAAGDADHDFILHRERGDGDGRATLELLDLLEELGHRGDDGRVRFLTDAASGLGLLRAPGVRESRADDGVPRRRPRRRP